MRKIQKRQRALCLGYMGRGVWQTQKEQVTRIVSGVRARSHGFV